ncbi:glycosyl transferase family 90-domain-containing protein [Mycena sanguinolenta]|nr:glycosyl transferase family 90-domain-containing protein [Mycena sanguinolenta]
MLAQAAARYTLHTGSLPPAYCPDWFRFAQGKHCLIHEYHRVHRNFKSLDQLAAKNATAFQDMLFRARKALEVDDGEIVTLSICKGRVSIASGNTEYVGDIPYMVAQDSTPFHNSFRPKGEFFARQTGCNVPVQADGFMRSANNFSAYILYPTQYYYDRSRWSAKFAFSYNVPWNDKKPLLYWRGTSTGGMIAVFAEPYCGGLSSGCDREGIIAKYNMTSRGDPREDVCKFKYALDVDGETFSGRFLGLMHSGSLVFKAKYFNDCLRPFEHYVPVLPDLSDLVQKVEWANANPEEARLIQQPGQELAKRVLTDAQNDYYMYAGLVEWAQFES